MGCNNDTKIADTKIEELNIYEQIGRDHNEGLDFILDGLDKGVLSGSLQTRSTNSVENLHAEIEKLTIEYINTKSSITASGNEEFITSFLKSGSIIKTRSSDSQNLSTIQQEYLNELYLIISDTTLNFEQIISDINSLEQAIIKECQDIDKHILLSSTLIAKHSLEYWYNNSAKWITKLCSMSPVNYAKTRNYYPEKFPGYDNYIGRAPGFYAYPYDPRCYVEVHEDSTTIWLDYCPPGLLWDEINCVCNWEDIVVAKFSWREVGRDDISAGAWGGLLGSFTSGSLTLGAFALPGWAAGAILGAIGGSGVSATNQLIDIYWF